jgi:pimeloyl-ACP methyl ester carboxylesterase
MDDLRTVMDESGIDRAVLVANLASSFMAMVFAATYPARVRAGIEIRAGVHTGEVEVVGDGVRVSQSTSVPACRPSRAQMRSSSARRFATWSQGRVCNSKTVVPASSRVCRTHGGFSR